MHGLTLLASSFPENIRPNSHLDPASSWVLIYLIINGAFLAWALIQLLVALRFRAQARLAEAAFDAAAPLAPGETTLFGVEEHALDRRRAVRVEVDQHGEESENSGVWTTKWTEIDRRVFVEPFYLKLASGQRVRVEPDQQVYLVDDMDSVIRVDLTSRTRFAELTPGERTYAHGRLERGLDPETEGGAYRATRETLVLKPVPRKPMLLSTEPLGERFARWWRFDRRSALVILLCGLCCQLFWKSYHLRVWAGVPMEGVVTRKNHYTTEDDDGNTIHHYQVFGKVEGAGELGDKVNSGAYARITEGMTVPWRVVKRHLSSSAIGSKATVHNAALVLLVLLPIAVAVFYAVRRARRPWYEREQLEDSVSGRLTKGYTPKSP